MSRILSLRLIHAMHALTSRYQIFRIAVYAIFFRKRANQIVLHLPRGGGLAALGEHQTASISGSRLHVLHMFCIGGAQAEGRFGGTESTGNLCGRPCEAAQTDCGRRHTQFQVELITAAKLAPWRPDQVHVCTYTVCSCRLPCVQCPESSSRTPLSRPPSVQTTLCPDDAESRPPSVRLCRPPYVQTALCADPSAQTKPPSVQTIICPNHTVSKPSSVQTILCPNHPLSRPSSVQTILCPDHPLSRPSSVQTILCSDPPLPRLPSVQITCPDPLYPDHARSRPPSVQITLSRLRSVQTAICVQVTLCPLSSVQCQ